MALFVIGGSSAILTETLAAYTSEDEPVIPRETTTTTREGKRRLIDKFFDGGGWARFIEEYPVYSAQTAIDLAAQHSPSLHVKHRTVEYLDKAFELPEREFSIYQFFAEQKKKEALFTIRMQFGGAFDGHYEKFKGAWNTKRAFSSLLPEPVRRIHEAVEEVFGTDPRAGLHSY